MRNTICVVCILCSSFAAAQQVEVSAISSGSVVNARLDWQAIPGETYSVESTDSLLPTSWTNLTGEGMQASNVLGVYEMTVASRAQFFRVSKHDTSPPDIDQLIPEDDAVAVASNATVYVTLSDETGIDTNSLILSVAEWPNMTMAGGMLSWSNDTVIFDPPDSLGEAGSVVTNSITVADTLGYTLSNSTWTFQIDRTDVATDEFVPLTAPPAGQGISTLSIGGAERMRSSPGVSPLSGTDEYHVVEVTSNTVVFSYSSAPPAMSNGTVLVSFDAAYPFYRSVVSNTVDGGVLQVTAWTADIPLTELVEEGSVAAIDLLPGQSAGAATVVSGDLNLLHVEFGSDLSGTTIAEDAGVRLHLSSGSWSFVGDIDVAFDIEARKLQALNATAGGSLNLNMTPEVLFYQSVSGGDSVPLIAPVTHIFGGMVGAVPVWVEVSMELNAGYAYSASVSGSASTTIDFTKELTFRLKLRDNIWTSGIDSPPIVLEADPISWAIAGEANAKVFLQPKLTVFVYSLAGPWIDIKPYAEVDGWYHSPPLEYERDLYFGLSSTLGIESRIWYEVWGVKPEWTLFDWRELVWSESYPTAVAPTFISAFPDRAVTEGNGLTLSAHARGTPSPGYAWFYNGSKLIGETGPQYAIPSLSSGHEGIYSVEAQNAAGSVATSCVVTVNGPTPTLTYPSGPGIAFREGEDLLITWEGFQGDAVRIDVYKGGVLMGEVFESTPNDGLQATAVPTGHECPPEGHDYRARITSLTMPEQYDYSDNDFSIIPAYKGARYLQMDGRISDMSTGVNLTVGQRFDIMAAGQIRPGYEQNGWPLMPPEGRSTPAGSVNYCGGCVQTWPFPGAPEFALIGRIGNGPYFVIGERLVDVAPAAGELRIMMNDPYEYLYDNSGNWDVSILYY